MDQAPKPLAMFRGRGRIRYTLISGTSSEGHGSGSMSGDPFLLGGRCRGSSSPRRRTHRSSPSSTTASEHAKTLLH